MTDEHYELPEAWVWTTLGQLAERRGGGTPSRKRPDYFRGEIPWITVADLPDVALCPTIVGSAREAITQDAIADSSAKLVPPDSVVFATRVSVGKVGIAERTIATNQDFRSLLPGPAHDPKYIARYLSHVALYRLPRTRGTTIEGITADAFDGLAVPLPPLPEQQRIVAKIEALFEKSRTAREALDRIPPLLKKFRQSVLAAAFRGDLTRDWRDQHSIVEPASALLERILAERRRCWEEELRTKGKDPRKAKYEEPNPVDTTDLPELPEGWLWTNLDSLISDARYGTSQKCNPTSKGVAVLRIPNLVGGLIDLRDLKFAEMDQSELARLLVRPGDVLVVRTNGSLDLVGKAALVADLPRDCAFASYLIRLRPVYNSTLARYVSLVFTSRLARDPVEAKARSTAGQFNVNLETLRLIRLPLPPLPEMEALVDSVTSLLGQSDVIERAVMRAHQRADRIDQSILARAFRGELVLQDPNDEPASTSLDSIQGGVVNRRRDNRPRGGGPEDRTRGER